MLGSVELGTVTGTQQPTRSQRDRRVIQKMMWEKHNQSSSKTPKNRELPQIRRVLCAVMIVQSDRIAGFRGNSIPLPSPGGSNNFKCNSFANRCRSTQYPITSKSQPHRLTICPLTRGRCAGVEPACSVGCRVCCAVGVVGVVGVV